MRGDDDKELAVCSYVTLAQRILADHPAGQIGVLVDRALCQGKLRGLKRVDGFYRRTVAAYDLVSVRRLIPIERRPVRPEVCLEAGKTAFRRRTTTEIERQNRPRDAKISTEMQIRQQMQVFPQPVEPACPFKTSI